MEPPTPLSKKRKGAVSFVTPPFDGGENQQTTAAPSFSKHEEDKEDSTSNPFPHLFLAVAAGGEAIDINV